MQKVRDPLELSSDGCVCTKKRASCPCKPKSYIKSTAVQTESIAKNKTCKCDLSGNQARLTGDSSAAVPTKSPIKLKSVDTASSKPTSEAKVKHYDFSNRYNIESYRFSLIV